jgi:hypothetical protein
MAKMSYFTITATIRQLLETINFFSDMGDENVKIKWNIA